MFKKLSKIVFICLLICVHGGSTLMCHAVHMGVYYYLPSSGFKSAGLGPSAFIH